MSEIKNCPFCGATASDETDRRGDYIIRCDECLIQTVEYCNRDEAISIWNTRAANKRIAELEAENARLIEALTPSGDTKAEYSGEFKVHIFDYMDEETEDEIYRDILIPWDQIKQIMAAIKARAAIEQKGDGS